MRRKKAKKECYKGSSGKSLQWDPIKKRWKIPGAELEEEEVKVAPPPKFGGVKTAEARPMNRYASSFIEVAGAPLDTEFKPPSIDDMDLFS